MQYVNTGKRELFPSFAGIFLNVFYLYLVQFLVPSSYGKSL